MPVAIYSILAGLACLMPALIIAISNSTNNSSTTPSGKLNLEYIFRLSCGCVILYIYMRELRIKGEIRGWWEKRKGKRRG